MRILVVDDEADLREILQFNIQSWGYDTLCAESAESALEIIRRGESVDLILLDVMLPGMSGFKLASIIRGEMNLSIPIIFLTAKISENDMLTGFSAGGDDYITKPFSINEVRARIQAVLKRSTATSDTAQEQTIHLQSLTLDPVAQKAFVDGKEIALSKKEYDILHLLAANPGRCFSRGEFLE
ncbi:MAG: response regulator transcription factor, partial [Bacteroidales bacterium]|nr:response regulator transcription factor [Bacteroidales bacterium]